MDFKTKRLEIIEEFKEFLESDIEEAIKELKKIQVDKNRKHLQKLIFANVVDRFDHLVDKVILSSPDNPFFNEAFLKSKEKNPINERQLIEAMLNTKEDIQVRLQKEFESFVRSEILRGRHSHKLEQLLKSFGMEANKFNSKRINESTGKILSARTNKHKAIPLSIIGYADWVYSRRSAVVHGGSSQKMSANDEKFLNEKFGVKVSTSIKILMGSITSVKQFYTDLIEELISMNK